MLDVVFEFAAEVLDEALHRHRRGITQAQMVRPMMFAVTLLSRSDPRGALAVFDAVAPRGTASRCLRGTACWPQDSSK